MEIEEWKDIEGYEGLYQVSNMGRVKSLARYRKGKNGGVVPLNELIMKPRVGIYKYVQVGLCKDGITSLFLVHRLVAKAFIPNPENKPCVDHIDRDRTNNKASNLRWCTTRENLNFEGTRVANSVAAKKSEQRMQHWQEMVDKQCKRVKMTKPNGDVVYFKSVNEADRNGYDRLAVRDCCHGRREFYKHCKFEFA